MGLGGGTSFDWGLGSGRSSRHFSLQSSGRECKSENDEAMDDVGTVGVTNRFLEIGLQSHSTIQTLPH